MTIDGATIFAWFVMVLLFVVFVWVIFALGSLPKKIALKRNHPQVDAINAASWIGLALVGAGWPIAFIWAFLRSGKIGYGEDAAAARLRDENSRLHQRVAELEDELRKAKGVSG